MSNEVFQQNLDDKKGPQPGGPYLIQMLFKEPVPMPDKDSMTAVMEKHIGAVECFCHDKKTAGFATLEHIAEFKDGKAPVQLMVMGCNRFEGKGFDDFLMSQMWDCQEDRERIFRECQHQVVATDMLAAALPALERANLDMDFLDALAELYPTCEAFYLQNCGKLFLAEDVRSHQIEGPDRFIRFGVNVRFFNIQGTEDMLIDTVGMSTLFLPDLQYVENNHPAIIDADTFAQVQEELARRASKRKVKQIGTTTEQGKYCGKYALTELLVCGECGTPYRRCTWTAGDQKRIVWRCINRLDYGKKYCHHSPTIEESPLQKAIMNAILKTAKSNPDILQTLKMHIQIGLGAEAGEDESVNIQIRIAQIDKEFGDILNTVTAENPESLLTDPRIEALMNEKRTLENRLAEYIAAEQHRKSAKSRLEQIFTILDGMKNHPLTFDNEIIRKILQCVIVESKDKIKVILIGGLEVESEVE